MYSNLVLSSRLWDLRISQYKTKLEEWYFSTTILRLSTIFLPHSPDRKWLKGCEKLLSIHSKQFQSLLVVLHDNDADTDSCISIQQHKITKENCGRIRQSVETPSSYLDKIRSGVAKNVPKKTFLRIKYRNSIETADDLVTHQETLRDFIIYCTVTHSLFVYYESYGLQDLESQVLRCGF